MIISELNNEPKTISFDDCVSNDLEKLKKIPQLRKFFG